MVLGRSCRIVASYWMVFRIILGYGIIHVTWYYLSYTTAWNSLEETPIILKTTNHRAMEISFVISSGAVPTIAGCPRMKFLTLFLQAIRTHVDWLLMIDDGVNNRNWKIVVIFLCNRICPGDEDAGQWTTGGHLFWRKQTSVSHPRKAEEEG